jgi:Tfp pilus assembly protein PilO
MNRISPAKRNELILVILGTATLLVLVYLFLISPEKKEITRKSMEIKENRQKLEDMQTAIKNAADIAAQYGDYSNRLAQAESDIAAGDIYAWTYDTIRRFKSSYHLDIPGLGQPSSSDVDLMPGMAYRQVKVPLSGTGYYHDLGKFVADFENTFPHMRLVNLGLDPSPGPNAPERLAFHFDVVALVKSGN